MGDKQQITPVLADIWPTWHQLLKLFTLLRFPLDFMFTPGSWRAFGVDMLSGLRANRSTSKVADCLRKLGSTQVGAIVQLAQLNVQRHEQIFRVLVIFYVSVPFSLFVLLFQAAPQDARRLVEESAGAIVFLVFAAIAAVLFYLAAAWRARQLLTAVTLAAIEAQARNEASATHVTAAEAAQFPLTR